jgi:TonB family protein
MKSTIVGGLAILLAACAKPEASTDPVMAFGEVDVLPARQSGPQLEYPAMQREAGVEGKVELEFVVWASGAVDSSSLKILSSSNAAFEAPARHAVLGARYTPGQNGGHAVPVRLRVVARFLTVHADGSYDTAAATSPTPLTAFYDPRRK